MAHLRSWCWWLIIPALLALVGCGDARPRTYGALIQTAVAQGCWAGSAPTPLPVTVTPPGGTLPTATATSIASPGVPNRTPGPGITPLPTTTPLPRCTPVPGQTQEPWPTPLPTEPRIPTRAADFRQPVVDETTVMHLPNAVLALDVAVHPTENWPVVAAIDIPVLNHGPAHVFVRANDPRHGGWGTAQTVDTGDSHPGRLFRSVAVGVTGDGTIYVVWGVTDFPALALYVSSSTDGGETWSAPLRLGGGLFGVLDVATTLDGQVVVLAMQRDPELAPVLFQRGSDGTWGAREALPLRSVWYASGGALAIVGDGMPGEPALVALVTGPESQAGTVYLLRRPLSGGRWSIGSRQVTGATSGVLPGAVQAVTYSWHPADGQLQPAVTFAFTMRDTANVFALTSLDGGQTWGEVEPAVHSGQSSDGASSTSILSAAPAYDPVAQQLVLVWTCCVDGRWGETAATHYLSRSAVGSGRWLPELEPERFALRQPLVSHAQAVGLSAMAQAANTRVAWLTWIEDGHQVRVRTLALDRVIPYRDYPGATP